MNNKNTVAIVNYLKKEIEDLEKEKDQLKQEIKKCFSDKKKVEKIKKKMDKYDVIISKYARAKGAVEGLDIYGESMRSAHQVSNLDNEYLERVLKVLSINEQQGLISELKKEKDKKIVKEHKKIIKKKYKEALKGLKKIKKLKSSVMVYTVRDGQKTSSRTTIKEALDDLEYKVMSLTSRDKIGNKLNPKYNGSIPTTRVIEELEYAIKNLKGDKYAPVREYLNKLLIAYNKTYLKAQKIQDKSKSKKHRATGEEPYAPKFVGNSIAYQDSPQAARDSADEIAERNRRREEANRAYEQKKQQEEIQAKMDEMNSYEAPGRTR